MSGPGLGHLARRFFGMLRPGGPAPADDAWAVGHLLGGEVGLWRRMSGADRRHAVGVARRVAIALGQEASRPVLAAALLHDVGKIDAAIGPFRRVAATVAAGALGRNRLASGTGRYARYLRHDVIGGELLAAAGSDPLTVAWAAEHHRPPEQWTVAPAIARALKAADDD